MSSTVIFCHWILAIVLFVLTNWIGKHSMHAGYIRMSVLAKADEAPAFNFLYRAFAPVAFITIIAAISYDTIFEWIIEDIYLVVVYYFIFRLVFNLATGRALLLNWATQIAYWASSIPVSYYVYDKLIIHKKFLFPSSDELGSAVWLAIVAYVYQTFNKVRLSDERTRTRKASYLEDRFSKFRKCYGTTISDIALTKTQEVLIYAVLINEDFNRPKIYRFIENLLFHLGWAKTLGVMQVTTTTFIDDEQSVKLGASKIVADHDVAAQLLAEHPLADHPWAVRRKVLELYNPDSEYVSEVDGIFQQLVETYFPEVNEDMDWKGSKTSANETPLPGEGESDDDASRTAIEAESVPEVQT